MITLATRNGRPAEHDLLADVAAVKTELSPRQAEVVALMGEGFTDKEIAERLFLAPSTVKSHIDMARLKLGARNRPHMVTLSVRAGQQTSRP